MDFLILTDDDDVKHYLKILSENDMMGGRIMKLTPRKVLTLNASNVTQHLRRSHQLDALSNILSTSAHHI